MARIFRSSSIKSPIPTIIAIVITVVFGSLASIHKSLSDDSFLTRLETRWTDAKFKFRGTKIAGDEVVIVGIDENSLTDPLWGPAASLQHDKLATVVRNLAKAKPKVIGFDILLDDPDGPPRKDESGSETLSDNDRLLADAIREAGNVILGASLDLKSDAEPAPGLESTKLTPELEAMPAVRQSSPSEVCLKQPCKPNTAMEGRTLRLSLPEFLDGAKAFGFVNFHPDREGRLREQPEVIRYLGAYYLSLDLQLVRTYLDQNPVILRMDKDRIRELQLGTGTVLPVDQSGRYMLNFRGKGGTSPKGSRRIVSIIDVLKDQVPPSVFAGKIVLLGAETSPEDLMATPYDSHYPGVELHADIIDNVLRGNFLRRSGMEWFDVLTIVFCGALLGIFIPRMNTSRAIFWSVFLFAGFTIVNVFSFTAGGIVLGYIYPGVSLLFTSGSLISYQYLTEEREKKRYRQIFRPYLDPNMIDQVIVRTATLKLGGEKREMSVLFSDIRGFTSFSEKMAPTEVVNFLNQYFDRMTGVIFQYQGTLDKLIGDAVMCFWGHPLEIKDHAVRSTLCALGMIQAVEDLRPMLLLPGGARFDIGIGVNTGPMVVGNMGSQSRFSYTVMGNNVSLGTRLESSEQVLRHEDSDFRRHLSGMQARHSLPRAG